MIKKVLLTIALSLNANMAVAAANASVTLDGLLQEVREFTATDRSLNKKREQLFNSDLKQQKSLLLQSQQRLKSAEAEQEKLKTSFDANDVKLAEIAALIEQRSGQLGEVFGVAKEEAGKLRSLLEDSLVSAERPGRAEQLAFAELNRVPTLKELETLWYQLQLEMTESGRISRFQAPVVAVDGHSKIQEVVRFGLFGAASKDGEFLNWNVSQQVLSVLPTQPAGARSSLLDYLAGNSDEVTVDPTRGGLFMLLDREPKLLERIQQGGEVGYLILVLGALGLLVAFLQMILMLRNEFQIRTQLRHGSELNSNNALGRVLLSLQGQDLSNEQRELKVDEAILQELPRLERGQSFIKLLAAVAPLLGLLGTVIGMIATFQSITLFGTSDPKLMAGGISQALMTTVLGLVVAIPLLFCHSYLATRGRRLTQVLQEKSLGLLAETTTSDSNIGAFDRAA
ncbi:MotA/TolQ/ExbB proton channel family protein [Neptunomonas japonica]|uniref:MotA/TolQ/ExbB proton channel family protein n=1 Tax=Neptunomonas japonica TaxID=417574 RepID=UPI00040B50A6|nr:MotA/TolQ/ExbB proton channel family protein [Neptunomonas japonica]